MTYLIAVANQKGGVAKTTTTFSLGGVLAEQGYEVLLVDLDCQGNLSYACGVDINQAACSILDVFYQWETLTSVSRETQIPGLDLVPAHTGMEMAERFLPVRKNYQNILRTVSQREMPYDFVIFDCPPSLGAVTQNAVNAANLLITPVSPELFSLEALRNVKEFTEKIQFSTNPELKFRLLVTMVDRRLRIHKDILGFINESYLNNKFETIIQVDSKLRECFTTNKPVNYVFTRSRSAAQYKALSEEILQDARDLISSPTA